ncbi:MAG: flavin reductase [Deltaproteobacteria bacterium]|nr:flavin reductase [Deltaproteobacteria bacterium]
MEDEKNCTRHGREITDIDRAFDVQVRGVAVITTSLCQKLNGMSAAWISRVSEQPFLAMVSVWKKNFSHQLISKSRIYAINYLKEGQQKLAIHFGRQSGRDVDKLKNVPYFTDKTGAPILCDCLAYLDCKVVAELDAGDHTIFLGEVLSGKVIGQGHGLQYRLSDYIEVDS